MKLMATLAAGVLALAGCASENNAAEAAVSFWPTLDGKPPLVIAHRGASGYLPEHTIEAYALAIEQGADVIEPDLVFTKDGVLVARHDRYLSTTTDVASRPEFADRKKPNADPNDAPREDWWVEDFTLAELKTLRAVQPFPGRPKEHDGLYEIPTFEEVLALVSARAAEAGRPVGVYPETKHPGYFAGLGMDFAAPLLAALEGFEAGPVFIQSFEPDILKRLKGKTGAKLVQLVYEETPGAGPNIPLTDIAEYADGVGPEKGIVVPGDGKRATFVDTAHKYGLFVHPWTFRNDQLNDKIGIVSAVVINVPSADPKDLSGAMGKVDWDKALGQEGSAAAKIAAEYSVFFGNGVDGVFTDFPDTAVKARAEYRKEVQ